MHRTGMMRLPDLSLMDAHSRRARTGLARTGRAAPKDQQCWATSIAKDCETMCRRILGTPRIRLADRKAVAAKQIYVVPAVTVCSTASRSIRRTLPRLHDIGSLRRGKPLVTKVWCGE